VINHLWQSTVFATLAAILTLAFRRNRAQVRYWLWLSASLKFLIPFALLMSLGSSVKWTPAAKTTATPAVTLAITQITQPFPDTASLVSSRPATGDWTPVAMLAVWACGFAVIALIRFRGWLRVRAAIRASSPLDILVPVDVRSSLGLLEPGVVGFLRPILLLPEGIAEYLTPRQLEAVLAHELCHIRRRDNLTSAIHMIVEAIFWFHPLVWWIGARLVEERERACDEAVLSLGSEPQVYAEGVLNVCKIYLESPLRCVSGVTGSDLKKRIQAILTGRVAGELNFAKRAALTVAGITALALPVLVGIMNTAAIRAQSRAGTPKFEVASIKPGCAGSGDTKNGKGAGGAPSPGRLNLCRPLAFYIDSAYVMYANGHRNITSPTSAPIEGGPAWINSDRYQISAKAEGTPSQEMMNGPMLQVLLEDRFKLKIHRETREVAVYELTVAKGGPKMQPLREGSCIPFDPTSPPRLASGQRPCGVVGISPPGRSAHYEFPGFSLNDLSKFLPRLLGRPVIDKTGLTGVFDFHLEFALDESTPGVGLRLSPSDDPIGGPSIFTAVQEQLGLKLGSARGPGEFLVIDHVERPTEN
jgi:bla regulator protein blaR1